MQTSIYSEHIDIIEKLITQNENLENWMINLTNHHNKDIEILKEKTHNLIHELQSSMCSIKEINQLKEKIQKLKHATTEINNKPKLEEIDEFDDSSDGTNSTEISSLPFRIHYWNGEHIGEIDKWVIPFTKMSSRININLIVSKDTDNADIPINVIINATLREFKSTIPLIVEEIKKLFSPKGLRQIGILRCTFKNKEYLLTYSKDDKSLSDYNKEIFENNKMLSDYFILEARKIFAFRYLLCLYKTNESSVTCRFEKYPGVEFPNTKYDLVYPVMYCNNTFALTLNGKTSKEIDIPKTVLNKYFKLLPSEVTKYKFKETTPESVLLDTIHELLSDICKEPCDAMKLRFKILEIINKYDKSLVGWVNVIYERINQFL